MNNKLGINDRKTLEKIEEEVVKLKFSLLNYEYTFNEDGYSFDYLSKLHNYLFGDIYYLDNNINSRLSSCDIDKINELIQMLVEFGGRGDISLSMIVDIFYELWELQIFNDGNTRTLLAFLKIYINAFCLDIVFDYDQLLSGVGVFDVKKFKYIKKD